MIMLRGSLLGFLHLGLGRTLLQFFENDLDPIQTKRANVDLRTNLFVDLVPYT